ncbi:2',3'-cyclic-nucleotide 3'-phosphodiesterase [Mycena sp. CBHHK59/15]|nr:2',3'-cyclic-nucleotide 3'-phosphodiesterase [Mycena sp. CBHHK59/15]
MDTRPQPHLRSETSYSKFQPHITLAALPSPSPSLAEILSSIPESQPALPITFDSIEVGSHFFRSVYIAVRPTSALSDLHHYVHAKLGIEPKTPAYPHISLCYINDADAATGERVRYLQELENTGKVRRNHDSVSLNCGDHGEDKWLSGFQSPEIWIVNCEGPVETWTVERKISLC